MTAQSHLDSSLPPQKKRELQHLRAFCSHSRMPVVRYTSLNPPDPDWVIELDQGGTVAKIGVELTELSSRGERGSGDRRLLAAWQRVKGSLDNIAKTKPELKGVMGRGSTVNGTLPGRHSRAAGLAKELAESATAWALRSGHDDEFRAPFGDGYPLMNQFVGTLWLLKIWDRGEPPWYCRDLAVGWLSPSIPALEAAIKDKTRKAKNYRVDRLDELWPLVVSGVEAGDVQDSSGPDWDGEVGEILKGLDVTAAPFHKVFLFEMTDNWVYEVWPRVQAYRRSHAA